MLVDFCLPVRNEALILENSINKLRDCLLAKNYSFDWRIVIILNNCNDDSEKILNRLAYIYQKELKFLAINPEGKSGALKYYFSKSEADIIVFMDIDLAVSLDDLDLLILPVVKNEFDLVFGSRFLKDSKVERSFFRSFSSLVYNYLSRKFLKHKFRDLQCGFKAFKSEVFLKIKPNLRDDKWFFDTEFITYANYYKFRIKEIPVNWDENRYEKRTSKVNVYKNTWTFIKNLIRLRAEISKFNKS